MKIYQVFIHRMTDFDRKLGSTILEICYSILLFLFPDVLYLCKLNVQGYYGEVDIWQMNGLLDT